jgi:hypothetical protein
MSVRSEFSDKWVRAYVDDVAVVDTKEPLLFWEEHFPVPSYAFSPPTSGQTCCGRRETIRPESRPSSCPKDRSRSGST